MTDRRQVIDLCFSQEKISKGRVCELTIHYACRVRDALLLLLDCVPSDSPCPSCCNGKEIKSWGSSSVPALWTRGQEHRFINRNWLSRQTYESLSSVSRPRTREVYPIYGVRAYAFRAKRLLVRRRPCQTFGHLLPVKAPTSAR